MIPINVLFYYNIVRFNFNQVTDTLNAIITICYDCIFLMFQMSMNALIGVRRLKTVGMMLSVLTLVDLLDANVKMDTESRL